MESCCHKTNVIYAIKCRILFESSIFPSVSLVSVICVWYRNSQQPTAAHSCAYLIFTLPCAAGFSQSSNDSQHFSWYLSVNAIYVRRIGLLYFLFVNFICWIGSRICRGCSTCIVIGMNLKHSHTYNNIHVHIHTTAQEYNSFVLVLIHNIIEWWITHHSHNYSFNPELYTNELLLC